LTLNILNAATRPNIEQEMIDAATKPPDYFTIAFNLDQDININYRDSDGRTLLTHIARLPQDQTNFDLAKSTIKKILDKGPDPNITDNFGFTPLIYAVHGKNLVVLDLLLNMPNLQINKPTRGGQTALDLVAISLNPKDAKIRKRLLEKGALMEYQIKQQTDLANLLLTLQNQLNELLNKLKS
jgi:ankyrin repeat protein